MKKEKMTNKPDIVEIIITEGVELKKRGRYYWSLCPLHSERTASFKVDPDRQSFYCFGCQEHGDVITFIQRYKGLCFKDALAYLGINGKQKRNSNPREVKKRELIQEYRQWLDSYTNFLCDVLRRLDQAKLKAKTLKEIETMAFHYHSEPIWEHHLETLLGNDERAKFELYKELRYGKREIR
jgi:DNA primase